MVMKGGEGCQKGIWPCEAINNRKGPIGNEHCDARNGARSNSRGITRRLAGKQRRSNSSGGSTDWMFGGAVSWSSSSKVIGKYAWFTPKPS